MSITQQAWDGEINDLVRNLRRALAETQRQLDQITERMDRPEAATHAAKQLGIDAGEVGRLVAALHTVHRLRFARPNGPDNAPKATPDGERRD